MKLTIVNRSHLETEHVTGILNWLGDRFADVKKPVRVTILKRPSRWGVWGRAFWPTQDDRRRAIKPGEYSIRLYVGQLDRPGGWNYSRTYKKRAGAATYEGFWDVFTHTAAHELRHVEQFWTVEQANPGWQHKQVTLASWGGQQHTRRARFSDIFKKAERNWWAGSCEVDAERIAHRHLNEWKAIQKRVA